MAAKKTCKRKRILNKDGSINKTNVEHNKKCEKDMLKDNPWLNEQGGEEYAEAVLGKDHTLMKEIKKEIKKTKKKKKHKKQIKRGSAKATKAISKKKTKKKKKKTEKKLQDCKIPCHNINEKKYKNKCLAECDIKFGKKNKEFKIKESKTKEKNQSSNLISEEKYIKKKVKKQHGGALCLPCISPMLTGFGIVGAGAAATGAAVSHKHSSSSSSDGKNIYRKEIFELFEKVKKKKKITKARRKFTISQKNNKVIIQDGKNKLIKKFKTIIAASKFYHKKVVKCKKDGFKKCIKGGTKKKHSKKKHSK